MSRFGYENQENIKKEVENLVPRNTKRCRESVWRQFIQFCEEKGYEINNPSISVKELCTILESYAFNMKKKNSEDYKEGVVKVMWNSTAKQLQEMFFHKYNIKFDPFTDLEFSPARAARDAMRKKLQKDPLKRKVSSATLSHEEYKKILENCDENTPTGLQRKFFYVASHELAWRGGEGFSASIEYFLEETDGRIEYNPVFSKTAQGGIHKLTDSKWLVRNDNNPEICPVRLFKKLLDKRGSHIITKRLFLTPNPNWHHADSKGWYKNSPVGKNTISTWFKVGASGIGIDTKKKKVTNHSARATAVSNLAKHGVGEQQLIKITGHSNSQSIKPYLQLDAEHHQNIIESMRSTNSSNDGFHQSVASSSHASSIVYNNCIFNITNNK